MQGDTPGGNIMAVGYVSYAAPVASTPATLGVTPPQAGGTAAPTASPVGNAATATAFDRTPATTPIGARTAQPTVPQAINTVAAQNGVTVATAQNAHAVASQQFGSAVGNNLMTANAGGSIGQALTNGVSNIVAFAQKGMADIQKAIQGDMAANNGQIDPAKMQLYTMQMSTFELLNQLAAKIQEKEDNSIQRWLR
jgi:hypothetical protein